MSFGLWATEAARRKRTKPLFPGSARFNAAELHFDVQKTRDGVTAMEQHISPLASGLNSIIDLVNSGDKENLLKRVEEMASIKLESVASEVTLDESTTRPWSNGGSVTPDASLVGVKAERMESLQLAQSTRSEVGDMLPSVRDEESPASTRIEENGGEREAGDAAEKIEQPIDDAESTRMKTAEETKHGSASNQNSRTLSMPNAFEAAPAIKPNDSRNDSFTNDGATMDKEEAKRPAQEASDIQSKDAKMELLPQSSPKPDHNGERGDHAASKPEPLAPKPAKSVTLDQPLPKSPKAANVKIEDSDSEEVSDTSFQAISSAIRKSFAGRVSMGNTSDQDHISTPKSAKKDCLAYSRRSSGKYGIPTVKKESGEPLPQREQANALSSSSTKPSVSVASRISKRTSVFVSLPSREPITYQSNKRHSIKVKMEEAETPHVTKDVSSTKAVQSPVSRIPTSTRNEVNRHDTARAKSISTKSDMFMSEISRQLSEAQKDSSKVPVRHNGATSKATTSPVSNSPTKLSSPSFSASVRSKSKPGSSQGSRTTAFGSPNHGAPRLATAARESRPRSRSPVRAFQRNGHSTRTSVSSRGRSPVKGVQDSSPSKVPQLHSAASSRSPTRYDQSEEKGAGRYSVATSTTASTPGESKNSSSTRHAQASSNSVKSAVKPGKERRTQNKFLTTTLNPQSPPKFNAVKTSFKNASPIKRFLETDPDTERLELKERRLKLNDLATSKVNLQHLPPSSKVGEQPSRPRGTSPSRKRAASPVKREPSPLKRTKPVLQKVNKVALSSSVSVSRRRAAVGNAQPLPDAARGKFVRSRGEHESRKAEEKTPLKSTISSSLQTPLRLGTAGSPTIRGDALPDIPSDDESLKSKKYLKGWANTPELQKLIRGNQNLDPADIFGKVSDLRMDEVFESTSANRK